MRRGVVVLMAGLWFWITPMSRAYAGEWAETSGKVWAFTTGAFVVADKVLHWSWETLHNKIVHPTVSVVTFGTVDLSAQ